MNKIHRQAYWFSKIATLNDKWFILLLHKERIQIQIKNGQNNNHKIPTLPPKENRHRSQSQKKTMQIVNIDLQKNCLTFLVRKSMQMEITAK